MKCDGIDPTNQKVKRPTASVSTTLGKCSDAYTVSKHQQVMAEPEKEDILAKLLEGQKQAKLALQKNGDEIKKQFTDMKSLTMANISKFDEYMISNDSKAIVVMPGSRGVRPSAQHIPGWTPAWARTV